MAGRTAKRVQPEFKGFISCELSEKQRQALKAIPISLEELDNTLTKLIEDNYKVSMSWDTYNSCYQAFLSTTDDQSEHSGWILSGRGSTASKSLKQLFYKHFTILKEQWSSAMGMTKADLDD